MDIKTASISDILLDVTNHTDKPSNSIMLWLEEDGYEPGLTRVKSSELYRRFCLWAGDNSEKCHKLPTLTAFGQYMRTRFKQTIHHDGHKYWIRRGNSDTPEES
jgi:hypothetical protein